MFAIKYKILKYIKSLEYQSLYQNAYLQGTRLPEELDITQH